KPSYTARPASFVSPLILSPSKDERLAQDVPVGRAPGSWFDKLTTSVLPLTLAEAVHRAVENNPDLAIVRLGTEAEAARVGESKGAFAPVFSTIVGRSSNVTPPSNFLLGDRGVDVNDVFSSTGIRQRVAWGSGTWSLSWDTARTTSNSPLNSFDPALQSGFQIAFSQPLLRDR